MTRDDRERVDGLQIAFDLFAAAEALLRQTLRRRHPGATDADVEAGIVAWLSERPGAEAGDAAGRPGTWPRR